MLAVERASSSLSFPAKCSLQMLLKETANRNVYTETNGVVEDVNYVLLPNNFKHCDLLKNCAAESSDVIIESKDAIVSEAKPKNKEQGENFSYSQKLFHIADGNLYSIFSPRQGRSYGVKPSFLKKRRCTIRESQGRKRQNKGLKFHNFVPSKSITSEKDESFLKQKWKIHSECKLREEHGTKQIMVYNWLQSVKSSEDRDLKENNASKCEELKNPKEEFSSTGSNEVSKLTVFSVENYNTEQKSANISLLSEMPCNSTNCQHSPSLNLLQLKNSESEVQNDTGRDKNSSSIKKCKSIKFGVLNNFLYQVENSKIRSKTLQQEVKASNLDKMSEFNFNHKRCRRKPHHTRRIVPYNKYLSILEEKKKSLLDLSLQLNTDIPIEKKARICCSVSDQKIFDYSNDNTIITQSQESLNLKNTGRIKHICCNDKIQDTVYQSSPLCDNLFLVTNDDLLDTCISTTESHFPSASIKPKISETTDFLYPLACGSKNDENKLKDASQANFNKNKGVALKNFLRMKSRKQSQRSAIKQKLEDTFRQNGFLVKTKQVSDGKATFCKFRQLRKYTRYYLKSWKHHLPEELHKIWKGFLPPKTALPPISDSRCNKNLGK